MSERYRILVVDDHPDSAELVREMLRGHHDATCVFSGFDALIKLQAEQYDLVISDWKMPEVSGVELLGWIRRNQPYVGLVLITGAGEDLLTSVATGDRQMIVMLLKPLDQTRLLIAIDTLGALVGIRRRANAERRRMP